VAGLCLCLLLVAVVVLLTRGDDDPEAPDVGPPPVARAEMSSALLLELQGALADRDPAAAEKLADPDDEAARTLLTGLAENARALRVADLDLRFVDEDLALSASLPDGQWAAAVDTTWRFAGFDTSPSRAEVTFTFAADGDRAALVGIGGGARRTPLWLRGPLQVSRTPGTLVMVDGTAQTLQRYAGLARRAVPVVRRVLPGWRDGLVVEVPASATDLDGTLGAEPGEYAAIAAVTTTPDGSVEGDAPVHVFVNQEVFGPLKPQGAQVVMSHEATHVATDAVHARTPLWLLEGFADYVALRDVDLPLAVTAGQIIRQVRRDGAPRALPGRSDFDTTTTHLGATYEAAWIACRLLARIGGEPALADLYRRASRGADVDVSLQELFGIGEKEFTRRWRTELESIAR
jgi:hypothetical protein